MELSRTSRTQFADWRRAAARFGDRFVPVVIQITDDQLTPVTAFLTLDGTDCQSFLCESVEGGEQMGRYSFIGVDPFVGIVYQNGKTQVWQGQAINHTCRDPRQVIAEYMAQHTTLKVPGLPPFVGGLVGNFGYDTVRLVEPTLPDSTTDDLQLPDIHLMGFRTVVAFDHVHKSIYLVTLVAVEGEAGTQYERAIHELEALCEQLNAPIHSEMVRENCRATVSSNMTETEFKTKVKRIKEHILAGDAFQVVFSQRFESQLHVDPFLVYRCLRTTNPSPYLFYLNFGDWQMIGSSPEILVKVTGRQVQNSPLAGTRKRTGDDKRDARLETEMLADPKERAEHMMLVDLARNDLGRIAAIGTVMVKALMYVLRFSTVMHIASDVTCTLRDDLTPLDALWACLPAGTLSGAPKIRAMEIIDELEPTRRGPYGGAVGFLSFTGDIETAIVIRTAVVTKGTIYWQAGAGIVADSDPDNEFIESWNKSRSILNALVLAGNNATPTKAATVEEANS